MSSIDLNKTIGSVLVALLVTVAIGILGNTVFEREHEAPPAYVAAFGEGAPEAAEPQEAEPAVAPIAPLLAAASVGDGAKIAQRCAGCHTFDQGGGARVGPNLWGVVGRPKAASPGFSYSSALEGLGGEWTYEDLNEFLASPRTYAPGTRMTFAGLPKVGDRADIIAYLRGLAITPEPLPEQ